MKRPGSRAPRSGASIVEFALVSSVTFFLILGIIVGSLGIFRYQQISHLAREGARYASTHGGKYILDGMPKKTGVPAISNAETLKNYLAPKATLLDSNYLEISVNWSAPNTVVPINYPSYVSQDPNVIPPGSKVFTNYVTVTISYQWIPEILWFDSVTFSSTSTMPMSY